MKHLPQHFLMAGQLFVGRDPCCVTTVLGSCVSVTMFSAQHGVAAMCHGMLPAPHAHATVGESELERWKYLSLVIPEMWECLQAHGLSARHVEVKMFGGGDLLSQSYVSCEPTRIGQANVRMAQEILLHHGLTVKASAVGGAFGRKIVFNTMTGVVRVRAVPALAPAA